MAAVPMLAGVGLLMVCCSSLSAFTMMGDDDDKKKKKDDDSDSDVPKTPEQIKADEAKAALDTLKADPDATPAEVAAAQLEADNTQATADADADADDPGVDTPAPAAAALEVAGYDYSKDDIDGQYADTDASTRDNCGTHCKNNNHGKNDVFTCEAFVFREEPKLCRLYDNAQITNVDISDTAYEVYRATGAETGADYTESCDDLGGGVRVRHNSGVDLNLCKKKCREDASCKGFIHKPLGFCQLHDNNDPYGADVCGAGYRVFRK